MDEQVLSLESDRGFGVLHIERADISLIQFEEFPPNMSRKFGVGFYQRSVALNGQGTAREYNVGAMSLKNWINSSIYIEK